MQEAEFASGKKKTIFYNFNQEKTNLETYKIPLPKSQNKAASPNNFQAQPLPLFQFEKKEKTSIYFTITNKVDPIIANQITSYKPK
ncbi:hypothetical protein D3C87_1683360 [compost metagenome]